MQGSRSLCLAWGVSGAASTDVPNADECDENDQKECLLKAHCQPELIIGMECGQPPVLILSPSKLSVFWGGQLGTGVGDKYGAGAELTIETTFSGLIVPLNISKLSCSTGSGRPA